MKRRILPILLFAAIVLGLQAQGTLPVSAYFKRDITFPAESGSMDNGDLSNITASAAI